MNNESPDAVRRWAKLCDQDLMRDSEDGDQAQNGLRDIHDKNEFHVKSFKYWVLSTCCEL